MADRQFRSISFPGLPNRYIVPPVENVAPAYSNERGYELGDVVSYNQKVYRCISAIKTPEGFTPTRWVETSVADEIKNNVGLTARAKSALLNLLRHVAYTDEHGEAYYSELYQALEDITLSSIEVIFNQGQNKVYPTNTLDDLSNADLVILDDLGSEFSDRSDPILYQVINDRLNKHKPTIITTNFTAQQINERYNERIFSRLFGAYKCHPFVGNDIRMLKNDQM